MSGQGLTMLRILMYKVLVFIEHHHDGQAFSNRDNLSRFDLLLFLSAASVYRFS
jgi:hypothetical protein